MRVCLSDMLTDGQPKGRLNQSEYYCQIDPLLASPTGEKDHIHNQLIAAIYGNVTREMPDAGLAAWVSTNEKPSASGGSKPASGDASERRLKGEVMLMLAKDRRRVKDLVHNDVGAALRCRGRAFANRPCSTTLTRLWLACSLTPADGRRTDRILARL